VAVAGCGGASTPRVNPPDPALPALESGWKGYAPPSADFAVQFPIEPTVLPASPQNLNYHTAGVQRHAVDDLAYVCRWKLNEKPYSDRMREALFLRGYQVGLAASEQGKVVEEQDAACDGFAGREYFIGARDGTTLRCRSFVAGTRVITLLAVGKDAESVRSPNATRFLDSLRISQ
jgi:hypothetical protein